MKLVIAGGILLFLSTANTVLAEDNIDRVGKGDWCYAPVHMPSKQEQESFIREIQPAAIKAGKRYGVPAPIIAGMAIVESGYGLTRIAIKSNNIFAFKWPGSTIAKGYTKFVLWCQPDWDGGNEYPAFESRSQAMDFVAWRLADSRHYRDATAAYQRKISRGADPRQAAIEWLAAIAPIYNYDPKKYIPMVLGKVRQPIKGSTINLWEMTE